MNKEKRFTLDNDTYASNPGKIKFEPLVWFLHRKLNVLILFTVLLLTIFLSVKITYLFLPFSVLMIFINAFYWVRAKEHFMADSNPGVIISVSPPLYAVYTDLTKGNGSYPVIKVMKYSSNTDANLNQKLATVATYCDEYGDSSPHWSDFSPLPVEYATSDKHSIDRELASYDMESWDNLNNGLSMLPTKLSEGLYKLETEDSNW